MTGWVGCGNNVTDAELSMAERTRGDLPRALRVDDADDRDDQEAVADLQHRRGELADGLLLGADHGLLGVEVGLADALHRHVERQVGEAPINPGPSGSAGRAGCGSGGPQSIRRGRGQSACRGLAALDRDQRKQAEQGGGGKFFRTHVTSPCATSS